MELVETRNRTENSSDAAKLRDALRKVVEQNPNGGEISLTQFCKLTPSATRNECVRALKKSTAGIFITGRRGKESRFVYGPPAIPFLTRIVQPQKPERTEKVEQRPASETRREHSKYQLRVGIGSQVTIVPLEINAPVTIELATV